MPRIIVNGLPCTTELAIVTYEQVVEMAGERGTPSVAYSAPHRADAAGQVPYRRSGEMHPGCRPVEIEEGMIFSAIHTGAA